MHCCSAFALQDGPHKVAGRQHEHGCLQVLQVMQHFRQQPCSTPVAQLACGLSPHTWWVGTRASQVTALTLHEASAVCPDMRHKLHDELPHVSAAGHQPARAAAMLPGSGVVALGSMRARRAWGDSSGWVSMTTVRSSGDTFGKHVQGPWHEAKHQMSKRLLLFRKLHCRL